MPSRSRDGWSHPPVLRKRAFWCNIRVWESLADRRVRAVAPEDGVPHSYFVFTDGRLFRAGVGSTREELVAEVPHLQGVALYVHGPWVCVTERFGVNASLVNTSTGAV